MPTSLAKSKRFFFIGQVAHLVMVLLLLALVAIFVDWEELSQRQLFGIDAHIWFAACLFIPILHQVYVWLAWRSELCFGTLTRLLGDRAFLYFELIFLILLLARPISLTFLAIADHDSFKMSIPVRLVICTVLGVPAAYTFYSVVRYFGIVRAAGIDHFEESYRNMPLVKKGMFKYSSNSMYTYGFLILWVIAIAGASWSAILVAAFNHAYVWVHYVCTEKPDMQMIYGSR